MVNPVLVVGPYALTLFPMEFVEYAEIIYDVFSDKPVIVNGLEPVAV